MKTHPQLREWVYLMHSLIGIEEYCQASSISLKQQFPPQSCFGAREKLQ